MFLPDLNLRTMDIYPSPLILVKERVLHHFLDCQPILWPLDQHSGQQIFAKLASLLFDGF